MRALSFAFGAIMVLVGVVWTLQGAGYLEGSPMTDQTIWAVLGPILAGFGVALIVVAARRSRRTT